MSSRAAAAATVMSRAARINWCVACAARVRVWTGSARARRRTPDEDDGRAERCLRWRRRHDEVRRRVRWRRTSERAIVVGAGVHDAAEHGAAALHADGQRLQQSLGVRRAPRHRALAGVALRRVPRGRGAPGRRVAARVVRALVRVGQRLQPSLGVRRAPRHRARRLLRGVGGRRRRGVQGRGAPAPLRRRVPRGPGRQLRDEHELEATSALTLRITSLVRNISVVFVGGPSPCSAASWTPAPTTMARSEVRRHRTRRRTSSRRRRHRRQRSARAILFA